MAQVDESPSMSALDGVLLGTVIVLAAALRVVVHHYGRYRLARREEGRGKPWLLPRVPLRTLDPAFETDPMLG